MKSAGTISISIALRATVVSIFGLVLMFVTSPLLTGLTLAILPVLLIAFRIFTVLNKKYTAEGLTASAEASTVAEESFGSIRTVCLRAELPHPAWWCQQDSQASISALHDPTPSSSCQCAVLVTV